MTKEKWEIEYDKKQDNLRKGISKLSSEQLDIVDRAIDTLFCTLNTISECYDLDLRDVRALQDIAWDLRRDFLYEERNKQK